MKKFTKNLLFIKNGEQVIVGNKYECTFLKISNECYEILERLLENRIDCDAYNTVFQEKEDAEYFKELYERLTRDKIFVEEDDEEQIENFDIQWEVTNKCNLHCRHCLADAVTTNCCQDDKEKIYRIADKILDIGPQLITITGGEPMILPFFFELSEYIRSRHKNELDLMTNGTYIDAESARKIAKIYDAVYISIDGVDEESCSKIRGAGVFRKVMDAVEHLKKAGVENISLSFVLTSENLQYEEQFRKICSKLGVKPMVRAFSPVGRGEEHKEWYLPEIINSSTEKPVSGLAENIKNGQPVVEFGMCGGRYGSFNIGAGGEMYWCAPYEAEGKSVDNILDIEDTYKYFHKESFKNSEVYKEFEKKMPENYKKCSVCNVRYFCWHCPFLFEQAIKNNSSFDKYCQSQKRELMFALWGEG